MFENKNLYLNTKLVTRLFVLIFAFVVIISCNNQDEGTVEENSSPVSISEAAKLDTATTTDTTKAVSSETDAISDISDPKDPNAPKDPKDPKAPKIVITLKADPEVLWPPNRKMVPVEILVEISKNAPYEPYCKIISVESNEPEKRHQRKHKRFPGDWEITGELELLLRAERDGKGDGRIYTIGLECLDIYGKATAKEVTVSVPHNMGNDECDIDHKKKGRKCHKSHDDDHEKKGHKKHESHKGESYH